MLTRVILLPFLAANLLIIPAAAQETLGSQSLNDLEKCYNIQKDKDRLKCYDSFAKGFQKDVEDGSLVVVDTAEIKKRNEESFGFEQKPETQLEQVLNIQTNSDQKDAKKNQTLRLSSAKKLGNKKYRFYTENGQVWDQIDATYVYIPKNQDVDVVIKKGSLGSFKLRVNGKGSSIRVKRVK